ncbi:MAG: PAS domain-containing protein [Bacteroidota bacterium]
MIKERITSLELLKKYPFLLVVISIIFAAAAAFVDAIIDYLFYYEESIMEVFFPSLGSHEFYMRMMLIFTISLFGFLITFLFKSNIKYQETLKKNEFLFKTVANYTNDWEFWITPDKKINFMSPSCLEVTGYSVNEFIENPDLIYSMIYEEDRELYIKHDDHKISEREIDSLEYRIRRKDGEIIWIGHTCTAIYDENKKYLGQRVSNRVITQRKLAEQEKERLSNELQKTNKTLEENVLQRTKEIQDLFSQSPFAKALLSIDKVILETNKAWDRMFRSKSEQYKGKVISDLPYFNNVEITKLIEEIFRKTIPGASSPIYVEEIDKIIIVDCYPITNTVGDITKMVCNIEDVTDRLKKAESDKELELQKHTLKSFFNFFEGVRKKISQDLHDQVGQNLLLVKMYTELLKDKHPESSEKFEEIINLLVNTNSEIKDIIYLLHPAELENYGLVEALQSMFSHCSTLGKFEHKIKLFGKYKPASKDVELGIYRICQEALNNITRHSQATIVDAEFHFTNQYVTGIITDNGIGFNPENILGEDKGEHVFGLSSMKGRAKFLNGNLEINSSSKDGTKIHFEIPIEEN